MEIFMAKLDEKEAETSFGGNKILPPGRQRLAGHVSQAAGRSRRKKWDDKRRIHGVNCAGEKRLNYL